MPTPRIGKYGLVKVWRAGCWPYKTLTLNLEWILIENRMTATVPFLSIVTPTRGDFSEAWLKTVLAIEGDVECVLVYHPFAPVRQIADRRVREIVSPYKGEMMQRYVGLLNARGDYILCLDDDDLVHPGIARFAQAYFQQFPESWVLRPAMDKIDQTQAEQIFAPWPPLPEFDRLPLFPKRPKPEPATAYLSELPIAPMDKGFDPWIVLLPGFYQRRDDKAPHIENGNNKIWSRRVVAAALPPLSRATELCGALKWIPNSGADRLFGLFFQAQTYQRDRSIGHWLLGCPGLIRFVDKDPKYKPPRFHVVTDFLLLKSFPTFGYAWNLFFAKLYGVPRTTLKAMRWRFLGKPK